MKKNVTIKDAIKVAVKRINNANNSYKGYVQFDENYRLFVDGSRFVKGNMDNFICNFKVEEKQENGRYFPITNGANIEVLDYERGLNMSEMVNMVYDAYIKGYAEWKMACENNGHEIGYIEWLDDDINNDINKYIADNTEDLNTPDSFIGLENASNEDNCDAPESNEDNCDALEFLRETMPIIPINIIKESITEFISDEYEFNSRCGSGFFKCDFEVFVNKIWDIAWEKILDADLSDEALESVTREYMEFDDRIEYLIDMEDFEGLYFKDYDVCKEINRDNDNMTIREYLENNKESDGCGGYMATESILNNPFVNEEFKNMANCTDMFACYVNEDANGDLYVCSNENSYLQYFEDDVPMVEVVEDIMDKMREDIAERMKYLQREVYEGEFDEDIIWKNEKPLDYNMVINYGDSYGVNYETFFDPYKGDYVVVKFNVKE